MNNSKAQLHTLPLTSDVVTDVDIDDLSILSSAVFFDNYVQIKGYTESNTSEDDAIFQNSVAYPFSINFKNIYKNTVLQDSLEKIRVVGFSLTNASVPTPSDQSPTLVGKNIYCALVGQLGALAPFEPTTENSQLILNAAIATTNPVTVRNVSQQTMIFTFNKNIVINRDFRIYRMYVFDADTNTCLNFVRLRVCTLPASSPYDTNNAVILNPETLNNKYIYIKMNIYCASNIRAIKYANDLDTQMLNITNNTQANSTQNLLTMNGIASNEIPSNTSIVLDGITFT